MIFPIYPPACKWGGVGEKERIIWIKRQGFKNWWYFIFFLTSYIFFLRNTIFRYSRLLPRKEQSKIFIFLFQIDKEQSEEVKKTHLRSLTSPIHRIKNNITFNYLIFQRLLYIGKKQYHLTLLLMVYVVIYYIGCIVVQVVNI